MADSVVSFAIEKLASLLEQEVVLLKNYKTEVTNITEEFKRIQALLKDADAKGEMMGGEQLKLWLKELRHVAFDIEDVLEEHVFRYHMHQPSLRGYGTCGFIHSIKHFFNKYFLGRHNLATRILDIKVRIESISKGKEKYNFADLNKETTIAATSSSSHRRGVALDPRDDALFVDEAKLVGMDESREKLIRWLVDESDRSIGVVSVYGTGGLGKTTLVKKVYESEEVKKDFKIRGWITVSQTFDVKYLLGALILPTIKKEEEEELLPQLESLEARQLKEMLHTRLQGEKYVIVMDDVWDLDVWKRIKSALPDSECGSRIIVTTRSRDIANASQENSGYAYELDVLTPEDSTKLFHKVAFKTKFTKNSSSHHLRDVIEKFLKKCGGLPLAIVAVAGFLSTKETVEWDDIYRDNGSLLHHSELDDVNTILLLSYNDLPFHLKSCLLYLCLFPEDYLIKCSRLLRLWVAEGFVDPQTRVNRNTNVTKEDVAKQYLDELIARSLIQVRDIDGSGRVRTCRIHDLLREFILTKACDQDFAFFMNWSPDMKPYSDRIRRLSISNMKNMNENILPKNTNFFSQIRSLFEYGETSLFNSSTVSTFLGGRIKLLKVLVIEGACLKEFPDDVMSNLIFLKYLGLSSEMKSLPSSLGKLINLETLEFSGYTLFKLPVEILELKHLCNLIGKNLELPKGIGRLTDLEKLRGVDGSKGLDVEDLGKLTGVRSLSITSMLAEDGSSLLASVEKMECLRSLQLSFGVSAEKAILPLSPLSLGVNAEKVDLRSTTASTLQCRKCRKCRKSLGDSEEKDVLQVQNLKCAPPQLQRLTIHGVMSCTPDWILSVQKLTKLHLKYSRIQDYSFFQGLQTLPNLVELVLHNDAVNAAELCFNEGSFSKLKTLELKKLHKLQMISIEEGAMPCIQHVSFYDCEQLENVPTGIDHLITLKQIHLSDMSMEFETKIRRHSWKAGQSPTILSSSNRCLMFDYAYPYQFPQWKDCNFYEGQDNPCCIM